MLGDSVRRRNPGGRPRPPKPERAARAERGPGLRWKRWTPILLGAAILPFLIGYAVAEWILFPPPEVAGVGIPVPVLRGRTQGEARQLLSSVGLGGMAMTQLPHPTLAAGTIIAQSPLPGQQLRAGADVRVAVSSGVPHAFVPDVVGFQADRAQGLLERLGFAVTRAEVASEAEAGRVLGLEPGPGSHLPLPSTVRLDVSSGPPQVLPDSALIPTDTVIRTDTLAAAPAATGTAASPTR